MIVFVYYNLFNVYRTDVPSREDIVATSTKVIIPIIAIVKTDNYFDILSYLLCALELSLLGFIYARQCTHRQSCYILHFIKYLSFIIKFSPQREQNTHLIVAFYTTNTDQSQLLKSAIGNRSLYGQNLH